MFDEEAAGLLRWLGAGLKSALRDRVLRRGVTNGRRGGGGPGFSLASSAGKVSGRGFRDLVHQAYQVVRRL